jgi:hypothetical protein
MINVGMRTELLNAPHSVLTTMCPPFAAAGELPSFVILAARFSGENTQEALFPLTNFLNICAVSTSAKNCAQETAS